MRQSCIMHKKELLRDIYLHVCHTSNSPCVTQNVSFSDGQHIVCDDVYGISSIYDNSNILDSGAPEQMVGEYQGVFLKK